MAAKLTQETVMNALDLCYDKAIQGIPGSKQCALLADEYLVRYKTPEKAAEKFIANQISKCTTSGFVTGLGGVVTLPVSIPANLASVWYVQLRMIATLAEIGGFRASNDETKTLCYSCLVKTSVTDLAKSAGVQATNKFTMAALKKLPGSFLTKINQKVGFRLLTKFGEKGVVNLVKLVPLAGGIVGGTVDYFDAKFIARKAYNTFIKQEID